MISQYEIIQAFRAPSATVDSAGKISYKNYKEGDTLIGKVRQVDNSGKIKFAEVIITDDGFAVLTDKVKKLRDFDDKGNEVTTITSVPADAMDKIKKIADKSFTSEIFNAAKFSTGGIVLGAAIAALWAHSKGKGFLVPLLIGGTVGGIAGKYISNKFGTKK